MIYDGSIQSSANYTIQISSSAYPGPDPLAFPYTRMVVLWPAVLTGGDDAMVRFNFVPADRPIPDSQVDTTTSTIVFDMFPPMDDYPAIVDLVRNLSPLNFYFDDTDPNSWYLKSSGGYVGEDQGK
jgi:hypothetical protein